MASSEDPYLTGRRQRWLTAASLWSLLAIGVALRIAQWAHNREFWFDEAYLALDLIQRPYRELTGPLSSSMSYPIAFLLSTKFVIAQWGTSEYAFRFIPLIAGIASLPLFTWLLLRAVRIETQASAKAAAVAIAGTALLAFSKHHIYYSSELRHYIVDAFAFILLYAAALRILDGSWTRYRLVGVGALGAVLIWYSIAAVFVLAAIALVGAAVLVARREWRRVAWLAASQTPWTAGFLTHLWIFKHHIAERPIGPEIEAMLRYLSVPFPPTTPAHIGMWREALTHFFYFPGGFTLIGLAIAVFLLGAAFLWSANKPLLAAILLPFLFALAAAVMHQYPFRNQYILFLLPGLYVVMAYGLGSCVARPERPWKIVGIVLAVVLLAQPAVQSAKVLIAPRSGPGGESTIKPLLATTTNEWREGDLLAVMDEQSITFRYYGPRAGFKPVDVSASVPATPRAVEHYTLDRADTVSSTRSGRHWGLFYTRGAPHEPVAPWTRRDQTFQSDSSTLVLDTNDLDTL